MKLQRLVGYFTVLLTLDLFSNTNCFQKLIINATNNPTFFPQQEIQFAVKLKKTSAEFFWVKEDIPSNHAQKLKFFANFLDSIHYFIAHITNLLLMTS